MTFAAHLVRQALARLGWKSAMLVRRAEVSDAAALQAEAVDGIAAPCPKPMCGPSGRPWSAPACESRRTRPMVSVTGDLCPR